MTISTKTVFKDYLAIKHNGRTNVKLNDGDKIDVLIKGVNAPDRLITVENQEVSIRQTPRIWGQMVGDLNAYKAQYPDRQVTAELWWILPRNAIGNAAARKRLGECTSTPMWKEAPPLTITTVDARPLNFIYKLEHLEFSSKRIRGEIKDYCLDVEEIWGEFGLVRDEDRAALLTLARATWPSVTAVDLDEDDRRCWFTLDGHAAPVTERWNVLIKQWVSKVHYRWWTTPCV